MLVSFCSYARNCVSEEKVVIGQLSELVSDLQANLPLNRLDTELLEKTMSDLDDLLLERAKGMLFRSRAKWHELGEKSTKYFFSLEKSRYNAKTCYKLIDENLQEIVDPQQILEKQKEFYSSLYSKDNDVSFNMQNRFNVYVPDHIREQQNTQISSEEVRKAISMMKNNKTPGQDGIPIDFYKVFWTRIESTFMSMVLECFDSRILHSTARKGILNLIPKANKDSRYVKNLRPITLLNTDYKIIEKVIAEKMIPALDTIIHKDQRGFMKDRRISVNIRKLLDIMKHTEHEDLEAVVLSLDFVKCFDKCSFSILHGSLDFFDFGTIVKEWTKILYTDYEVKIQNNGHFSADIEIKKGVHQGGCCSSIYFLVIAEILALSLRSNEDIDGITIKDIRNLLNQFADDMDICSICNEKSLKGIYKELNDFYYQSGFTVSYEKTTLYRIGSLRHSNAQLYDMSQFIWSNEDITVLGVTISHDNIIEKNFQPIVAKVKSILNSWTHRGLSLIGKIKVVNTLIASLFVYKMTVLPQIPNRIVACVEQEIRTYLWGGKKAKISLQILQNDKSMGGLNLVNLKVKDKSLKATWPKILYAEKEYAQIVFQLMRCTGLQEDIWRCRLLPEDVGSLRIKDPFWHDVLCSWSELKTN